MDEMGKGDFDVDGRCYGSPTMYHKPGAIHFTNAERTEFIRGCRYCEAVMGYEIAHTTTGLSVTRKINSANAKPQPETSESSGSGIEDSGTSDSGVNEI